MKTQYFSAVLVLLLGALAANPSRAQTIQFSEDFTGAASANDWFYFGGACLTAGTTSVIASPGSVAAKIPGCTNVLLSYYNLAANADPYLVGGNSGFLGSSTAPGSPSGQQADPAGTSTVPGSGALRFTNGSQNIGGSMKYGHNERGAILSSSTFPTGAGIQVTFKTVTYHGDSGGAGSDGADGISFFLQDGTQAPGLGAFGGSLAYSCANNNVPYDGLTGAYLGLGIDEYGNFLNGTNLVVGYGGTNTATGDNSAYGYGYKPGRIGLRGAGNVSMAGLTTAYGNDPSDSTKPFYPVSLLTSCSITGGTYSSSGSNCINVCSGGSSYYAPGNVCNKACTGGGVYDSGTNTCQSCATVNGTYSGGQCTNTNSCAVGTYFSGTATCDTCPATGYATGTYSSGTCIRSCPTGYTYNATSPGYCVPTGGSFSNGNYCPSGWTITGTLCYPTGASQTGGNYCPTGYTITGTLCYPTGDSQTGGNYCPSGQTISGTSCYPNGLSHSGTNYCPTGQTINGTFCYPTGAVFGSGHYCPTGETISASPGTHCCPSGYTWSTSGNICKNGGLTNPGTASTVASTATAMTAATPDVAATAEVAATPAPGAQIVAANQSPTLITTPVASAPATLPPTTGLVDAQYAVRKTCQTGNLYNYGVVAAPTSAGTATLDNPANTKGVLDYAPILNAYKEVTSFQIANEGAMTRGAATPIFYNLKITQDGLLSFAYSVSGGAYTYLIKNQSITASNGPLPTSFRVGFAASDGGASNVHEIMCFKAAPSTQSGSSATVNEKEAAKVEAGTQAYFAFYNPDNWTGTVTANTLIDNGGVVSVATTANWDAGCLLSGAPAGTPPNGGCLSTNTAGPTTGSPASASRIMLTWDTVGGTGIPFEWTNLNPVQQAALTFNDGNFTSNRLDYLRGNRSNEINSSGVGLFRARDSILGDIVDSSPNWVGPPASPYTAAWKDRLIGGSMPENSGTQTYLQFTAAEQTRLNVVYVGSNDGFLHGFRAGSFDNSGAFVANTTTPNDGAEVLAYMPGSTLVSAALPSAAGGCSGEVSSETVVQNIHGVTPAVGLNPACNDPVIDYSNSQYGHNFFVDATPGSGDLFYGGQWHTWLVGGLGVGGNAIYALDVTDPGSQFSEGNASNIVIGEWTASSIICANVPTCGNNMGNTFGTPQIRRLHNGNWAVIFGNGFGSVTGDAGIYVMSIDNSSGARTFYYLSTNSAGGNGIAYTTPADLDGDHITDFVYAGDLNGHVWRFDLTSNDPANWAASTTPMFTTQSGQPITSQLLVISVNTVGSPPRLLIEFGTGERTQITNLAPAQFVSGTQSLYGVWDWNLSAWNTMEPGAAYAALDPAATGIASPYTLSNSNLAAQTLTAVTDPTSGAGTGVVEGTNVPVCWQGGTQPCTGNQFGWYANLPNSSEQVIFNPVFFQGGFVVNTIIPANNVATSCSSNLDTGFTYALAVANGGVFTNTFPTFSPNGTLISDPIEAGIQTNAAGSVYVVQTPEGAANIVYQTISGTPGAQRINIPSNVKAKRLTWIEQR
ncbi:MAG TPA: PilC/PilY family type IV pilus protein [Steroidobacteraceae bacterium]|jgi:type IV pilus assembly protein PilY1